MEKKGKGSFTGQRKRNAYGRKYMPAQKKERLETSKRLKREFEKEKRQLDREAEDIAPLYREGDEEELLGLEEMKKGKRRSKKAKREEVAKEIRSQKIAANTAVEREKIEKEQRRKKRKEKDKRMRQRTKSGNVVMKNVIGDILSKIESDRK